MNYLPPPIAGAISAAASVITSFQEQLDWWVRFCGSVILLMIAVLSLVRAVREFRKPKQ